MITCRPKLTAALFAGLMLIISPVHSAELPLLEAAIGWPLDKLAEHSPNVAGLPKRATDHIGAYLDTPVRFRYAGDAVKFEVPQPHTFTVNQEDGRVSAIDIELPLVVQDPEPAFVELNSWSNKFDGMNIKRYYDNKICFLRDDISAARKIIHYDFEMSGASVGCWKDQNAIFSLGVTKFKLHINSQNGVEQIVPVYKVIISIWNSSTGQQ